MKADKYKELKHEAAEASARDACKFVHDHDDLILGASMDEIDRAVAKIAKALRELRVAKIDAERAKKRALRLSDASR